MGSTVHDYSDGSAAFGCIEGLRQNGYSGEITLISTDIEYPYDKAKLQSSIRNLDYDKLALRTPDWYDLYGVTLLFGREVTEISHKVIPPAMVACLPLRYLGGWHTGRVRRSANCHRFKADRVEA